MLKFYVSCRPLRYSNELVLPRDQFAKGFQGIDVSGNIVAMDMNQDGRVLYEVVLGADSSYSEQELADYKAIVLEGLAAFSCHLKSVLSAKDLAEKITGETYTISEDETSIVPPPPRRLFE